MKISYLPRTIVLVAALQLGFANMVFATTAANSCIACHQEIHEQIILDSKDDIHTRAGLSCKDCHGGDPSIADEESMSPKHGFVGAPKKKDIPQFCGKCHSDPRVMRPYNPSLATDQVEKYWTSRHGELLKTGDQNVATCTSCHKAHGIFSVKDSRSTVYPKNVPATCSHCHSDAAKMASYGIPTNQFAQYADSANVHGYALFVKNDMGAPVCNDCHGNHGAAPPGVSQIGQVCTQCHSLNGELFRGSPHKEGFDALGIPECAFCHQASPDVNNPIARIHTIVHPTNSLIGIREGAVCIQCHTNGDPGWNTASVMSADLDSLEIRLEHVKEVIELAEQQGMEVSDARWKLKSEVLQARMELRTSVHGFNLEKFIPYMQRSDTSLDGVESLGQEAVRETERRRMYYAIITALLILVTVALGLKIKEISKKQE